MKYLVVSYDDDQQQWFWDFVLADSEEQAEEFICTVRPYVIAADAILSRDLTERATDLANESERELQREMQLFFNP